MGLITNGLYDVLKQLLKRPDPQQATEIIQIEQPDGTKTIIIRKRDV